MNKLLLLLLLPLSALGQQTALDANDSVAKKKSHWYEKIAIRGYMQVRYNRLLENNAQLKNDQGDKSIGANGGIFIRRMRLVFFGQIHERIYFYIQPDIASAVSATSMNFAQIRDAYVDIGLDKKNEFRIRVGQSKVPYGFENIQSSQNRMPLDRADATNSGLPNERDLGVFLYWAPTKMRQRFAMLVREGLKGSGDYGVLAFGVFNGQTMNKPELNDELHMVARATYPFAIGKQIIEPAIQAYTGNFVIPADQLSAGVKEIKSRSHLDQRAAAGVTLYPQPLGIQAEYNIGKGPEFNKVTDSIETKNLKGGYLMVSYRLKYKEQLFFPFVRAQYYNGGKKYELDARSYKVEEYEAGIEWQPLKNLELTVNYTTAERTFEDYKNQDNTQKGHFLRIQAQLNF